MKNTQYINIQGWMINELKLKGNDLIIYAIIYGFSQDGESEFKGSLKYLMKSTNTSRPTVMKSLKTLVHKGMIIKDEIVINNIKFNTYKKSLLGVKKLAIDGKETLQGGSKETLPNNTIINTIEDRMANFYLELKPYLNKYGKEMLNQFYSYWTEPSKNGMKMRYEGERFFDLKRRLATWSSRNNKSTSNESVEKFNPDNYTD